MKCQVDKLTVVVPGLCTTAVQQKTAEKAVEHHILNGGMSRFEKVKFYHKNFLDIELNSNQINLICSKFSSIVVNSVIESSLFKGTINFLEKCLISVGIINFFCVK